MTPRRYSRKENQTGHTTRTQSSFVNKQITWEEKNNGCGTYSLGEIQKYQPIATCGHYLDLDSNRQTQEKNYDNHETAGNLDTEWIFDDIKELLNFFKSDNGNVVMCVFF